MEKELLTSYGYEKLTKELKECISVERPKIIEEVQIAREHGDLKENAEYHSAKEKQALMDKKIAELNELLTNSQIIDPSAVDHDRVSFGSSVTLLDLDTEVEENFTIVGTFEADIDKNLISYNSPLAKAILGKEEGEEIEAILPGGEKEYEVIKIEYKEIDFGS